MKTKKKAALVLLCALLLVTASVMGTLAYLTEKSGTVKNTFVVGSILESDDELTVIEHEIYEKEDGTYGLSTTTETAINTYTVYPGVNLPKDPFVKTDEPTTGDAYLFIEIVNSTASSTSAALGFAVDTKWTLMEGATGPHGGGVFKLASGEVPKGTQLTQEKTNIIKDKTVIVPNVDMTDLADTNGSLGDLEFYAYLIQSAGFADEAAAWAAAYPEIAASL